MKSTKCSRVGLLVGKGNIFGKSACYLQVSMNIRGVTDEAKRLQSRLLVDFNL